MEDDLSSSSSSRDPAPFPPPPTPPAPDRRFSIGYALAPKKQQSFIRPSLLSLSRSRGIDLVAIDPDLPLSSQGPFDCILHKLTGPAWKLQLEVFHSLHPSVPIIDSPDHIERLHNRISMLQFVSSLTLPHSPQPLLTFGIPNQIVVESDLDSFLSSSSPKLESLRFPVIAKPLVADGSAKSHKMVLVFHPDALLKLKPPIVLQEFVNHGGVIFKVYVVGDYVKCVKRKSLPDVTEEKLECSSEAGSISFSQVSNLNVKNKKYYEMLRLQEDDDTVGMPPVELVTNIARGLRQAMGLNLFNFDVIRDVQLGNHYLVIDINYFPGYAKMPSYESVLTDFFWDIVTNNVKGVLLSDTEKGTTLADGHDSLSVTDVEEEDGRVLLSANS